MDAASKGDLAASFDQLDKSGAVDSCGLREQADRLADEYVRLENDGASVVVVSQTWAEVHRVNSQVRAALKEKGQLGAEDTVVKVLDKLDLTNAQTRAPPLRVRAGLRDTNVESCISTPAILTSCARTARISTRFGWSSVRERKRVSPKSEHLLARGV